MKKLLLMITCTGVTMVHAQHMKHNSQVSLNPNRRVAEAQAPTHPMTYKAPVVQARTANKTTAAIFWGPETFGSGTTSSLPTNWSASSMPTPGGGTWKWTNVASTSAFSMGAMNSTSSSDGWMIFDSDGIGAAGGPTSQPSGYLQSPLINCGTEASVRLNFESFYRNFYDSCSVWVSTTPGFGAGSYAVYPVLFNNALPVNESSPNTTDIHINISGAAAMQPAIYIRFVYYGYTGGSYSWMIDDISLSSMDPVDGALDKASALYWSGSSIGWSAYGAKPRHLQDTVYPVVMVTNYGANGFPSTTVNAKIFQGSTNVYDQNITMPLPVNAMDSVADFTGVGSPAGYYSTTPGAYTVPFSINLTGDAETGNDKDTTVYGITDSMWMQNTLNAQFRSGQYVYNSTAPARANSPATGFVMSAGKSDTVTSVSIAFDDNTSAGQIVGAQIFHFDADAGSWQFDAVTKFHALAASEISSATSITWATFPIDVVATGGQMIMDGGADGRIYAAVVKGQSNTANVIILATATPGPVAITGGTSYSDTSLNDGPATQQFGQDGLPYGNSGVPMIALNFGNVSTTSITDVNVPVIALGKAMPNPANTVVNIPVTLAKDSEFTMTLSNAIGQVVSTQKMNAQGGQTTKATFATGNLPAGVYLYTVTVNGQQATGRVSVTH